MGTIEKLPERPVDNPTAAAILRRRELIEAGADIFTEGDSGWLLHITGYTWFVRKIKAKTQWPYLHILTHTRHYLYNMHNNLDCIEVASEVPVPHA